MRVWPDSRRQGISVVCPFYCTRWSVLLLSDHRLLSYQCSKFPAPLFHFRVFVVTSQHRHIDQYPAWNLGILSWFLLILQANPSRPDWTEKGFMSKYMCKLWGIYLINIYIFIRCVRLHIIYHLRDSYFLQHKATFLRHVTTQNNIFSEWWYVDDLINVDL